MKLSIAIALFLIACNSSAADLDSAAETFANYPNFGLSKDSDEKCRSIYVAAEAAGNAKDEGYPRQEVEKGLMELIDRGSDQFPPETKGLLKLLIELAYSPQNADVSSRKFAEDVKRMCEMPEVGACEVEKKAAEMVHRFKEEGVTTSPGMAQRIFPEAGLSSIHTELGDMLFWPEHIDKTADEFTDFIVNEWCRKYSKFERTKLFDARQEELGRF